MDPGKAIGWIIGIVVGILLTILLCFASVWFLDNTEKLEGPLTTVLWIGLAGALAVNVYKAVTEKNPEKRRQYINSVPVVILAIIVLYLLFYWLKGG